MLYVCCEVARNVISYIACFLLLRPNDDEDNGIVVVVVVVVKLTVLANSQRP